MRRTVDSVMELERDGERYLRHLEFQATHKPDVLLRCLEYEVLLLRRAGLPVVTTILYVSPPAPRRGPVYQVRVGDRAVNEWRFTAVRLWELSAVEAVASGRPGMMALAPLMQGADMGLLARACRGIETRAPESQQADLLAILHVFAEQRYPVEELRRLIGRERIMQSSIWQEAEAKGREEGREQGRQEGRAEGRGEGELRAERELCREMVARYHPGLLDQLAPVIDACTDPALLKSWVVEAPALSDDDYRRLLANGGGS